MDGGEAAAHEAIEASPSWRARSGRLAGWRLGCGRRRLPCRAGTAACMRWPDWPSLFLTRSSSITEPGHAAVDGDKQTYTTAIVDVRTPYFVFFFLLFFLDSCCQALDGSYYYDVRRGHTWRPSVHDCLPGWQWQRLDISRC